MNSVNLIGRLTRPIELKQTQSGKSVGNATIAVSRPFTDANGEHESDFINLVIWGKTGENMAKLTAKGSLVGVEGSIRTRNYENNQGTKVYVTEVVVNNFTLTESKEQTQQRQQNGGGRQNNNYQQPQGNFTKPQGNVQGSFGGQGNFQRQQQQTQPQRQTQPKQTGFSPEQMYGNAQSLDDQLPF